VKVLERWGGASIQVPRAASWPINWADLGLDMVVFDCAGTVVDEGSLVYQTLMKVLEANAVPFDHKEFDAWHGANKIEVVRHFVTKQEGKSNEARVVQINDQFFQAIDLAYFNPNSTIKVMAGALPVLDAMRAAGIKVALNTGYPRKIADKLIETLGLLPHIDGSIVAEEVGYGRPYPYMIHSLMKTFGFQDARRIGKVGDTVRDVEEGRNAGCGFVVGVLSGADGAEALSKAGADIVIKSVADIFLTKNVSN